MLKESPKKEKEGLKLVLLQRLLAKVKARKSASKEALRRHILFTQYIIGRVPYALDVQKVQRNTLDTLESAI